MTKLSTLFVGLFCIAYAAVRLWGLSDSCLWFDEIFSVHAAEHSWDAIFSFVAQDLIHPPLFYVLLKLWIAIGGESVFWLRSLPVLFSIAALIPFIYLCRELKLRFSTQLLALMFLTVNGSLIKYSQEVRMYSLLLCLSLISMWLFARYFNSGTRFYVLIIVNVLLVYTHYFGWLVVLTEVFAILVFQRIKIKRILLMFLIIFASFFPWLVAVWQASRINSDLGQNIGWMTRPGFSEVIQLILNLIEPFYYSTSSIDPISILRVTIPILLIVVVAVAANIANRENENNDKDTPFRFLLLFTGVPLLAAFIASWLLPYSVWGTRHLIIVFAPVSILVAAVITGMPVRAMKTSAITLLLLLSGYAFFLNIMRGRPVYSWCVWEKLIVQALATEEPSSKTSIYVLEDLVAYHVWFAMRNDLSDPPTTIKITGIEGVIEDKAYFLPRGFDDVKILNFTDLKAQRLWLVYRGKAIEEFERPITEFRARGYRIGDRKMIPTADGIAIFYLLEK